MGERVRRHLAFLEPCPFLPAQAEPLGAETVGRFRRGERGEEFYEAALRYAQSLWLQGVPAQSLLLINRAMGADLVGGERVLERWPLPYAAAVWVMRNRRPDQFIGNPRRHYQHLATRMVGPRKVQRTWRAWACHALADILFDATEFPDDLRQIEKEGVRLPSRDEVVEGLGRHGHAGEASVWEEAESLAGQPPGGHSSP